MKTTRKRNAIAIGLLSALAAWALGALPVAQAKSTKLRMSWKNPQYSGQKFHRILVIGMSPNPEVRADFEDNLSAKLTREGLEVIPGNSILLRPEGAKVDLDYLKSQIREFKIDAVVVTRLVKVDTKITHVSGQSYAATYPHYGTLYGYYGAVYREVYSPDYLREDKTVRVETNFYAATPPDGELIWTGISDTFNPGSARKVIQDLVKLVVKELEKETIL